MYLNVCVACSSAPLGGYLADYCGEMYWAVIY